jgi:glycosyl transferase family 25
MINQFHSVGLEFERVAAVDGRSLSAEDLRKHSRQRLDGIQWAPSEIGCFLSHRRCWQIVADGTAPFAAIFEDDLHLDVEVGHLLSTSSWIPAGVEIIKLEAPFEERHQKAAKNAGRKHRIFSSGNPWNATGAYVISRDLAKRLAQVEHLNCPVDQFLFDNTLGFRGFQAHEIRPGICIQASERVGYTGPLASVISQDRLPLIVPKAKVRRSLVVKIAREFARPIRRFHARLLTKFRELRAPLVEFPKRG